MQPISYNYVQEHLTTRMLVVSEGYGNGSQYYRNTLNWDTDLITNMCSLGLTNTSKAVCACVMHIQ